MQLAAFDVVFSSTTTTMEYEMLALVIASQPATNKPASSPMLATKQAHNDAAIKTYEKKR